MWNLKKADVTEVECRIVVVRGKGIKMEVRIGKC
jgi:hypothetical protein